jgi:hypothetical protein
MWVALTSKTSLLADLPLRCRRGLRRLPQDLCLPGDLGRLKIRQYVRLDLSLAEAFAPDTDPVGDAGGHDGSDDGVSANKQATDTPHRQPAAHVYFSNLTLPS